MPPLGRAAVVNHKSGDLDAAMTKFGPIDVWWENLREPNLERAVEHLAPRGRISHGRPRRTAPFARRPLLHEGRVDSRPDDVSPPPTNSGKAPRRSTAGWRRASCAVIGRVMKLSEAAEAHRFQEENTQRREGGVIGKILCWRRRLAAKSRCRLCFSITKSIAR